MGALVSSPRRPAASRRTPAPPGCRVIRTFPKDSLDRAAAQVGDVGSIKVIFFRSTSCSSSVGIVSSSVGVLISSSSRAFPGSGIRSRHFRMIRLPSPTTSEPTPAERRDGSPRSCGGSSSVRRPHIASGRRSRHRGCAPARQPSGNPRQSPRRSAVPSTPALAMGSSVVCAVWAWRGRLLAALTCAWRAYPPPAHGPRRFCWFT